MKMGLMVTVLCVYVSVCVHVLNVQGDREFHRDRQVLHPTRQVLGSASLQLVRRVEFDVNRMMVV